MSGGGDGGGGGNSSGGAGPSVVFSTSGQVISSQGSRGPARQRSRRVGSGIGPGRATIWTCDLTHGYVDINGSYRS